MRQRSTRADHITQELTASTGHSTALNNEHTTESAIKGTESLL